jgi:two-component system cell cycle sensor histidine kinase/response regulator CckA
VEDDDVVRRLVRATLEKQGYKVLETATPQDAIRIAAEPNRHIDLILTDVLMPGMRGPELLRRLRSARPGLPVLFMSGYSDSTFLDARVLEDAEYIQKPFKPEELGRKVRKALQSNRSGAV